MKKLSIVCATYNRAELLDKALKSYAGQICSFDWEYIIVDDMSQDDTKKVVDKYIAQGLPLKYYTSEQVGKPKQAGVWRDGCAVRNAGSIYARGEILIMTHPEIIIPPNALQGMVDNVEANPGCWITAIPYWMPPVEKFPNGWYKDFSKLRNLPGFYDPSWPDQDMSPGAVDYRNQNQEIRPTWESEVFWAMDMNLWREIGGFREFDAWGSVDMDFLSRRHAIGIKTVIAKVNETTHVKGYLMVYHQYHESKRDMDAAVKALQGTSYPTKESAIRAGGLYNLIYHGEREKPIDGRLSGILGDHIARYKFAGLYSANKFVADIPCGTGYGSQLLQCTAYVGVDNDAAATRFANEHYAGENRLFFDADIRNSPLLVQTYDLILSFEGIEHLPEKKDQQSFLNHIYESLKSGGTFILSTPQKGAAKGTAFDISILSQKELAEMIEKAGFVNVDWFYQMHYGAEILPQPCKTVPENAEIMIVGGTKP